MEENEVKSISNQSDLTKEELWSVLEFAQSITNGAFLGNSLSPYMLNDRMKDITLRPYEVTSENVEQALKSPKESEDQLRGYSETFELNSMIYKRMINYLSNLLSFDLTYVAINVKDKSEYSSQKYKNDERIVYDFIDRFKISQEFKMVMKQLMRQEAFFGILRDDGEKYTLQELPSAYCKIDGRWEYGLLFAFDMQWFKQGGVDIDMYPDAMKRMYNENISSGQIGYDPAISISQRGKSMFAQWVECSPNDNFWAWKFTPEIATRVPYLSALFADLALQPLIRNLQKNSDMITASKLVLGEIPLLNGDAKTAKRDQVAISPELLGKFLGMVKQGLHESIKVSAVPLKNLSVAEFDKSDTSMYEDFLKTTVAASGINSRLILSTEKPTALESQLSVDVDEFLMNYIYPYFESFLEYHINKRTKKYKFKFSFEGSEFSTSREKRLETQMKLMERGIVLPQKISAAMGMHYHDMIRHLEYAQEVGFADKLITIVNASQASKDAGRPRSNDGDLSEEGDQTRSDGGNLDKGGKI